MTLPYGLSPEEALVCLEGLACARGESWAPQVGPRRSALAEAEEAWLVRRLARVAGLDEDATLAEVCPRGRT